MKPTQIVEALLFASDAPLTAADMASADESLDEAAVEAALHALRMEYERDGRAFQIHELAGGFQLMTRPEFAPYLERFDTVVHTARLSIAALEVLAIIAYRQPIGRAEIEEIRGVGSSGVLRTLQERELITPVGRGDGLGRPLLYGTTTRFLEHFGFRSLEDLPRPEELPVVLSARARRGGEEPAPEGQASDDPAAHGTDPDGTDPGDPAADGTAADGTVTDGTVTDGTVTDGTVTDGTVSAGTNGAAAESEARAVDAARPEATATTAGATGEPVTESPAHGAGGG